jgi:hypothetical protein
MTEQGSDVLQKSVNASSTKRLRPDYITIQERSADGKPAEFLVPATGARAARHPVRLQCGAVHHHRALRRDRRDGDVEQRRPDIPRLPALKPPAQGMTEPRRQRYHGTPVRTGHHGTPMRTAQQTRSPNARSRRSLLFQIRGELWMICHMTRHCAPGICVRPIARSEAVSCNPASLGMRRVERLSPVPPDGKLWA